MSAVPLFNVSLLPTSDAAAAYAAAWRQPEVASANDFKRVGMRSQKKKSENGRGAQKIWPSATAMDIWMAGVL